MDAPASPPVAGTSLAALLDMLAPHDGKALVFDYDGRRARPGYHITEVKAGSFVALDCGGNPDAWQETILQVEDIPAGPGQNPLRVGRFRAILGRVDGKVRLDGGARVTIEIGREGEAMRVYDIAGIDTEAGAVVVRLGERAAICKPRHRTERQAAACCAPAREPACC